LCGVLYPVRGTVVMAKLTDAGRVSDPNLNGVFARSFHEKALSKNKGNRGKFSPRCSER
jgi:hypothetical protein